MSTYLPFGYRCQAAAAVSHQVNKQSPSESSDSGYKSETSNDDSRSCASEESQTSLACTSEYSKDSAIYPAHISHVSKVHEQNNPQQPSDLSYLQLQTHNVSGGIPLPQGSACSSSIAKVLPLDLRQNPRRSGQNRDSTQVAASQLPCTLRRGVVKRDCFVTRLVTFAAQLVGVIWPNANNPPRNDSCMGGKGVLPLDQFISEVLRRSRTSYSTLQIALYYLILLRPHLPSCDFTKEQPADSAGDDTFRALQCGRRMFLSALILASKYLQDRNYSTRAWSKISGLPVQQINRNETRYCEALDWRLHFPCSLFERWSCIIVRLCVISGPPGFGGETVADRIGWSTVVLRLSTPDVLAEGNFDFSVPGPVQMLTPPASDCGSDEGAAEPLWADLSETSSVSGRTSPAISDCSSVSSSTPTWEFQNSQSAQPSLPPVPQLRNLPTPQGTPQPNPDLFRPFSRRPSMCSTMSQARRECFLKATLDSCPPPAPIPGLPIKPLNPELVYRSSHCRSTASLSSSPESMISDDSTMSSISSCSSRSSSISSACAPLSQFKLAEMTQRLTPKVNAPGFVLRPTDTSASSALRYCLTPSSTSVPRSDSADVGCRSKGGDDFFLQPESPAGHGVQHDRIRTNEELEVANSLQSLRSGSTSSVPSSNEATPQPKAAAPPLRHKSSIAMLHPGHPHLFGALPISQKPSSPWPGSIPSSRDTTPTPTPSSTNIKRTHSKANSKPLRNTALHAQVRENLSATSTMPTVYTSLSTETPPHSPPHSPDGTPESKAQQSPTSDWAPTKIPIIGKRGCVKRLCSSGDLRGKATVSSCRDVSTPAVEEARRLMRAEKGCGSWRGPQTRNAGRIARMVR